MSYFTELIGVTKETIGGTQPVTVPTLAVTVSIDCTSTVHGAVQHSYYLNGACNHDIWMSIMNVDPHGPDRNRQIMPDGGFILKKTLAQFAQ